MGSLETVGSGGEVLPHLRPEKVASSKKHNQFKTRVQTPYPIFDPMAKIDTLHCICDQND